MGIFNSWQFYLIGYTLFSVMYNQFYRLAAKGIKRDGAGMIILESITALSVLFLVPFFPFKFSNDWKIYLILLIACIFYAINDRMQTTIRKNLEVSVSTIVNKLATVFLIIIGLVFLKEPFSMVRIYGAILIILANILLNYKSGKFKVNKYVFLALLSCLIVSIGITVDVGISVQFNLPIYLMITYLLPGFFVKVTERISIEEIKKEFQNGETKYLLITGISRALLMVFMYRAYQLSTLSMISPLTSVAVLMSVVVATIFFGERKNMFRKFLAALMIIMGVFLTVR